tara:strand:+ start:832 stop:1215 length:384 start_codon:yes stop_codon:yes gene_type:complete
MREIIIMALQKFEVTPPVTEVRSLLSWLVGILVVFVTSILVYLRANNNERIRDLKNEIVDLKSQLQKEIEYGKSQDNANIKLITDTGTIQQNSVKILEKNSEILRDLVLAQQLSSERLDNIQEHLKK